VLGLSRKRTGNQMVSMSMILTSAAHERDVIIEIGLQLTNAIKGHFDTPIKNTNKSMVSK
jgi:ERCC4-type nuclease